MFKNPKIETLIWAGGTVIFIIVGSILVGLLAQRIARLLRLSPGEQRKIFWGFAFASPWLIGFVIFVLGPSLASLYYSFTEYKLGTTPEWLGLDNYRQLIQGIGRDGRNFKRAMYNSLYYAIVGVPLQIIAALSMAMLLNTALRGIRTFRLIFYMPVILAGSPAILLAWRYMLGSNGGFVNVSLSRIADSFFLFDWLYRGFIFSAESFNGFFIGVSNGNPLGPFVYFLPALIGFLVALQLLRGYWEPAKVQLAQRTAEIITFVLGGLMIASAIVAEPIDISWIYVWGLMTLAGIATNLHQSAYSKVGAWQIVGLLFLALGFVLTLSSDNLENTNSYIIALVITAVAIGVTFRAQSNIQNNYPLLGGIALLLVMLLVQIVPDGLGDGRLALVFKYLTFQSAISNPDDLAYLDEQFAGQYLSTVWIYGAVALVMGSVVMFGTRYPQARRYLLIGSVIVFGLIAVNAFTDGIRFFNAHDDIAIATESQNFHFARFHAASADWPDSNHKPQWLSSDLWVKPSLILINMWSAGAGMLIFLAALKSVPTSLYEAAKVDGANRFQRFTRITLPMISPAMFYNVVIGMIAALQTFESVYILRSTETETSVMSAAFYLYRRTFEQANIGEGSAMSWVLAVLIVGMTMMQFRYSSWVNYEV